MDSASVNSATHSNENSDSLSFQSGAQTRDLQNGVFVDYKSHDTHVALAEKYIASSTEKFLTQNTDFSQMSAGDISSQNSPSMCSESLLDVDIIRHSTADHPAFGNLEDNISLGAEQSSSINVKAYLLPSDMSPVDSLLADVDPSIKLTDSPEVSHSVPVQLPVSPERRHEDSTGDSFQDFFNEVVETSQHSSPAADNICIETVEPHREGNSI